MRWKFILEAMVVRRTVSLPEAVDETVRTAAAEGESYSRAAARLIEAGARALGRGRRPAWIGSGRSGERDLGLRAEHYLRESLRLADRRR